MAGTERGDRDRTQVRRGRGQNLSASAAHRARGGVADHLLDGQAGRDDERRREQRPRLCVTRHENHHRCATPDTDRLQTSRPSSTTGTRRDNRPGSSQACNGTLIRMDLGPCSVTDVPAGRRTRARLAPSPRKTNSAVLLDPGGTAPSQTAVGSTLISDDRSTTAERTYSNRTAGVRPWMLHSTAAAPSMAIARWRPRWWKEATRSTTPSNASFPLHTARNGSPSTVRRTLAANGRSDGSNAGSTRPRIRTLPTGSKATAPSEPDGSDPPRSA